jgi:fatty acid-binding protein DegV
MSGTLASASLAAADASVPVEVIDTGTASFGVSVCVWAAGAALRRGATVDDVRTRVESLVPDIATAFMVGVPMLTERSGRAADLDLDVAADGVPVLAMRGGKLEVIARVSTVDDTVDVMSSYATGRGVGATVAIGVADEPSRRLATRLRDLLADAPGVDDVIEYRVGPSVGAHTGPGTFGLFVFPTIT